MKMPIDAYLFWIAAIFFFLAALYLKKKIKKEDLQVFQPINLYLLSIGVYFVLSGIGALITLEVITLLSSFAIIFGSSNIARFPLKFLVEKKENREFFFYFILITGLVLMVYSFLFNNAETQMRTTHTFAFITAGLFTIGYILFMGFKTINKTAKAKNLGTGVSLGLCCVVAHGLISLHFLPFTAIPLFGLASIKLPLFFAMLSPLAFILVLYLGHPSQPNQPEEERETSA